MYYLFRFATIVIPWLPRRWIAVLSKVVGYFAWLVANDARRRATSNMVHVLGFRRGRDQSRPYETADRGRAQLGPYVWVLKTAAGRGELLRTVRGMFQNSVRNYLEVFSLPHIRPQTILQEVQIDGLEHLEAALTLGKGVILVSAHLGPFEYIVQCTTIKGYEVTIPVERLKDQRLLDLMLDLRRSHGVQMLPLIGTTAMRAMIQALRGNKIVLIMADRATAGQVVEKLFFGAPARLPLGPVMLAQRTGAALVAAFCWRTSGAHIQTQILPLSLALPEEQRSDTDTLMQGVITRMEEFISAHPEQWVMFAPLWDDNKAPLLEKASMQHQVSDS